MKTEMNTHTEATALKKIYVAKCIEHGEKFTVTFQSSNPNKKFIKEFAQSEAQGWGGECISVTELKPQKLVKLLDIRTGKTLETTVKKFENFNAKMKACYENGMPMRYKVLDRYDEKIDTTKLWDADKTTDENLREAELRKLNKKI